ncbi:MAG: DUF6298 domain-containing protein, partial [Armatimonadota bacterium]
QGKREVRLMGDNFQGLLGNADFDHRAFLDELAEDGINFVACWLIWPIRQNRDGRNGDSDRWGTDYPVPNLLPWPRRDRPAAEATSPGAGVAAAQATGPARTQPSVPDAFDGYAKYDLSRFDERFWDKTRDLCQYARKKGIYVQLTLFDECLLEPDVRGYAPGWNWHPFNAINGGPLTGPNGFEAYNVRNERMMDIERAYVEKVIAETSRFDNVLYELCNEGSTKSVEWNRYWVEFISQRCDNPIGVNANYTPNDWSDVAACDYLTYHTPFHNGYDAQQNYAIFARNRDKRKPIIIDEANPEYNGDMPGVSPDEFRPCLWVAFMAGGHCALQDDSPCEYGSKTTKYRNGQPGRKQIGYLLKFASRLRLSDFRPADDIIVKGPQVCHAMAARGEWVVYAFGRPLRFALRLPVGEYRSVYYSPRTGKFGAQVDWTVRGGSLVIDPPTRDPDVAVYLRRIGS